MAMVKQYAVRDTHTRSITAVGYNPTRREIVIGFEDGVVKSWEAESGKLVQTFNEHKGWITDFLYWNDTKLLLSSANDAQIVIWGAGGGVVDKVQMFAPIYCMAISPRRHQLICGANEGIGVYSLNEEKENGHYIDEHYLYFAKHHTDIVRCILCHESRIYSAGYDQRLIIYDTSYTGDNSLTVVFNNIIHDAGIASLVMAKDNENNMWLLTGSFDKSLKIWSLDGKLIHKLDTFLSTVSGICYIPRNKTIWAAGGTQYASMFDPKTGDNVSDFIGTFGDYEEEEKYHLQILKFFPEFNQVVGSSNRRHFIAWKYNSSGCVTTLTSKSAIESLCYTSKVPILFFSGDKDGTIIKWERMQSNHFMYSKEIFTLSDLKMKKKKRAGSKTRELMLEQELANNQMNSRPSTRSSLKSRQSHSSYSFNRPIIPPVSLHKHPNTTILKILFVESMDYILAASEDSNIYVWGFDQAAVQVLKGMKPHDLEFLTNKYAALLDPDSPLLPQNSSLLTGNDSVTNRVAGFILKFVLSEHLSCVTSLVLIGRDHGVAGTFALSGGWDRRICLWDLEAGTLKDTCKADSKFGSYNELACDDIITDMDFSPKNMEFAYSCADKMVYIRKFSTKGSKMTLCNTLQGHEAEVTCVKWNNNTDKWVTGAEDGTIRIWSSHGMNECEQVLSTQGAVTCLCIDRNHGSIIAGVQRLIKVYDADQYRLVQTNVGHTDSVRCIIHITERNQYVSCSWDETIRVWNAWKMPRRRHQNSPHKEQQKNSTPHPYSPYNETNDDLKKEDKQHGTNEHVHESSDVLNKDNYIEDDEDEDRNNQDDLEE